MSELKLTLTHAFAAPGDHYPLDLVHPITGRGVYSGETAEQIAERHPGAVVVELDEWRRQRAAEQDAPVEWLPSTLGSYDEMLGCLPPAYMARGAFLVGEPFDHHAVSGQPRFEAYRRIGGEFFVSSRPMTRAELRAVIG